MAIQLGFEPSDFTLKTWRAVAAELLATGMFVFIGVGSVIAASFVGSGDASFIVAVSIAHGLGILLAVTVAGKISGGHINPAVTFAMAATGKMKVSTAILYVGAQLVGAVIAVLLLKGIIAGPVEAGMAAHGLNVYDPETGGGLLDDSVGDGAGAGLLVEVILTFFLVYVVFAVAIDTKGFTYLAPAAIGLVILADHLVGIPMTGASMNPARSFAPALVTNEWDDQWIYWVGPLIGAAIAALAYEYIFLNREE
jgi:aquaporin TIP